MDETLASPLSYSEQEGIARIALNRPRQGNSLSMELVTALRDRLHTLEARDDIKVIILSGTGGRIFSAGHDLTEFSGQTDEAFLTQDFAGIAALMQAIMQQPQIVIAMVEGVATAAGCELVATCDLAFASTVARFAVPGVNIGFWCHTPQVPLSRTVGRKHAMMMLATGKLFPAEHALAIGLINEVHPPETLPEAVDALAAHIATKASSVLRQGKRSFHAQRDLPVADAYRLAQHSALTNIFHPDAQEGIAAFLEKRQPRWPAA